MDKELAAQNRKHTKAVSEPVWREAVRSRVTDRLQTRVLSDTARVAVTQTNVLLRSAQVSRLSSGTPTPLLANATELGMNRDKRVQVTNRQGTTFTRRSGTRFKPNRRNGYVVFPAAREVIPRLASLWIQTTVRTLHETFEKGSS